MKFKTEPYPHQLECLNRFGNSEAFALLADMGTGKTWIIINNVARLWEEQKCDAVIVFAPNGVHHNWVYREIPKHMPDECVYISASWTSTPKKDERRALLNVMEAPRTTLRILTMNWEALQYDSSISFAKRFCESANKLMIVCDESDNFKTPSIKRTGSLMRLRQYSAYRRIMSGTPINNSPIDLFTQFNFLDHNILKAKSYFAFKNEYAEVLPKNHPLVKAISDKNNCRGSPQLIATDENGNKKYKNLDRLTKIIAPYSFRVVKSECLSLPDKVYKTILFDMTREQEKVYKQVKNEQRLILEDVITPINQLVAMSKLAQITSGYCIHPFEEEPINIEGDNRKLAILKETVLRCVTEGNKVIVWARFRKEISDIVKELEKESIKYVQYHGGVSKIDREMAIEQFERGDSMVFVGNQQSGGVGITLVAASYVIYFSNDFSLRNRLQSEDRAHRIGQNKTVTYINIAARGTIDEFIISAIENKKDISTSIIDAGIMLFRD